MKKLILLAIICFTFVFAKAEYDSYVVQIRITTIEDETINGFITIYDYSFQCGDSRSHTTLIESFLTSKHNDTLQFAENYFCYEFQEYGTKIGKLIDETSISKNEIKTIEYVDCFWMTTLCWIENEMRLADYEWTETPIVDYQYHTPFCEYGFYIHEWSDGLQDIIDEIVKQKEAIDSYGTSPEYEKALEKLKGRKVILTICC